ncbi:MAG: hypothetical protein SFW66_01560 [Gammaproteobacteria bacterium]|nr:hypothetical protein [Gammaproteobacteria bacterium]
MAKDSDKIRDNQDIFEYKQDVIDQVEAREQEPSLAEIHMNGVINVVEPIDLATFFGLSAVMPGSPLLATLGRFLLFPLSIICELARVVLGWRATLNIPDTEEHNLERNEALGHMLIDTVMTASMGVAFVGGFFWAATLSPLIFVGASLLGVVVSGLNAIDYHNKAEGQKTERGLLHDLRDREMNHEKRKVLNNKITQTYVKEKAYRAKAKINAITLVLNGLGLAALVGVMLMGLPALGVLGVASGVISAAIMGKKYYDDRQAAKKSARRHRLSSLRDDGDEIRSEKTTTTGLFERLGGCFGWSQPKPKRENSHSFFSLRRSSTIEDVIEPQEQESAVIAPVVRKLSFN